MRSVVAAAAAAAAAAAISPPACLCGGASSFALPSPPKLSSLAFKPRAIVNEHNARPSFASSAAEIAAAENDSSVIRLRVLDGSERSMRDAAEFMVDAFWLRSPQRLTLGGDGGGGDGDPSSSGGGAASISDTVRSSLVGIQADDLGEKYGQRMGRRKLDALVIAAFEEGEDGAGGDVGDGSPTAMRGMVTVEVRLLERGRDLLSARESESALTRAVSSLGPKQRREYKDASAIDVANQLLPPDVIAACSLSNLCVSPTSRRRGVAVKLCEEAERVAREELGFGEMYLRVERSNTAAVGLYEGRLGYERAFDVEGATALRVDVAAGSFVKVETDIVVLRKKI
jgi:ribosomal protein S18 acetylase RimI-like enzyme